MRFASSFSPFNYLLQSYMQTGLVWVLFFMGLIFSRGYIVREFCMLSLILLLSVFFVKAPHQQYYIMFLPLMAIIAGYGVVNVITSNKAIIYIVIIAAALPMYIYSRHFIENRNTYQLNKIRYVLSNTTKNDYVYDGNILFNVFRKDIDFFWFCVRPKNGALATYRLLYPYDYNIYELIDRFKPKIISTYYIDNLNNEIISKYYHPSPKYRDILIRNN